MSSIRSLPHISIRNDTRTTSLVERSFVRQSALATPRALRTDGRSWNEGRPQRVQLLRSDNTAHATVQWGAGTRVTCSCTAQVIPPYPDRPQEGIVSLSVDASTSASTAFRNAPPVATTRADSTPGSNNSMIMDETQKAWTNRILRALERILLTGGALDSEALCITPDEWVWKLELNLVLLDAAGGNLMDASIYAAMAALRHYRKPCLEMTGGTPILVEAHIKEPTPLPLHHTPLALSFAIIAAEDAIKGSLTTTSFSANTDSPSLQMVALLDPTLQEELVADGSLITIAMNVHGEICLVDYAGGCEVEPVMFRTVCQTADQVLRLNLCPGLEQSLEEADVQALRERLQRLQLQQQREAQTHTKSTEMDWNTTESTTVTTATALDVVLDAAVEQAQVQAEEAYKRQALDYNKGHMPTAVRETSQQQVKQQANALLQSLLQSVTEEEPSAVQGTGSNEAVKDINAITEDVPLVHNEPTKVVPAPVQQANQTNDTEDDDEEDEPILLQSEFDSIETPNKDNKMITGRSNEKNQEDDEDDVDDLVDAIRKKKKSKKAKK
ncbi:exosome complex component RRP45 [Fistulifera solaris]|uniref:Exosome complex component RRP45 n=1 Tax=Fistulifera solaris TaxID=1519565 RepID=A0A1Z5JMX0_FISSO|nr:exosome complex component RRP45 [Fistulifera solaris]|eukprot:GAX15334.1 exosome complex component RRP45 [Fistulifera solaris]